MRVLLALLLLAGTAHAQGVQYEPGPVVNKALPFRTRNSVASRLDFSACGTYSTGTKGAVISTDGGGGEACASGVWTSQGANQIITAEKGAWFGPMGNWLPNSDITAWTSWGASTKAASASCPVAPNGGRMVLVEGLGASAGQYISGAAGTPGNWNAISMWASTYPGDSDCVLGFGDNSNATFGLALSATPKRLTVVTTQIAGTHGLIVYKPGSVGSTCTRACLWGPQSTDATHGSPPFLATSGTAAAVVPPSVKVPTAVDATKGFCWAVDLEPDDIWWNGPSLRWVASMNAVSMGAANSAHLYMGVGTQAIAIQSYDGGAASRYCSTTPGWGNDGERHRLKACFNVGGSGAMTLEADDAVSLSLSCSGAGTGIFTATPPYTYVGGLPDDGYSFVGWIRGFAQCRSYVGCDVSDRSSPNDRVLSLGDSIVYGDGSSSPPYTSWVGRMGIGALNAGIVPAKKTADILALWRAQYAGGNWGAVTVHVGLNDCYNGGNSTTALANLDALYTEIRATGAKLVPMTTVPDCNAPSPQECIDAINNGIRAWGASHGVTVADINPLFNDGVGCLKAESDSGDHVHLNDAGYFKLASFMKERL